MQQRLRNELKTVMHVQSCSFPNLKLLLFCCSLPPLGKLGSLSNSVFERRTSTGSGLFASLGSGLVKTLGYIFFKREKKVSNENLIASRHIKRKKASLPVDVRRSKTSLLKFPTLYCCDQEILLPW